MRARPVLSCRQNLQQLAPPCPLRRVLPQLLRLPSPCASVRRSKGGAFPHCHLQQYAILNKQKEARTRNRSALTFPRTVRTKKRCRSKKTLQGVNECPGYASCPALVIKGCRLWLCPSLRSARPWHRPLAPPRLWRPTRHRWQQARRRRRRLQVTNTPNPNRPRRGTGNTTC